LDKSYDNLPLGDGGYSIVNLVIALIRESVHVTVITFSYDIKSFVEVHGELLKVIYVPCSQKRRSLRLFSDIKRLRKCIKKLNPEFVHAHWTYEYSMAAVLSGYPNLITARDDSFKTFKLQKNIFRFIRLLMDYYVCKKAMFLSANSPYLARVIERKTKKNIFVLPNLLLREKYLNKEKHNSLDNSYAPNIIMINNGFSPWKNTENAMLAFNKLLNYFPETKLHMYGYDFEENGRANKWIKNNGSDKNIIFHGLIEQPNISSVLDSGTIFLHTSLVEGFGIAPLEAMARKLPVIGGKYSGAIPWLLDNGNAGILCDVSNVDEITFSLKKLIENKNLIITLSLNGFERAKSFKEEIVVENYMQLINKLFYNV